jgi:hypothetical protein
MNSQPYEAGLRARTSTAARRELGDSEYHNALTAGAVMSLEEAIDYALGATTDIPRPP